MLLFFYHMEFTVNIQSQVKNLSHSFSSQKFSIDMTFSLTAPNCVHFFTVNDFNLGMQVESVLPVCKEHTVGTL